MWWNKKVEPPKPEPKFSLVKLKVQLRSGEHVLLKGTNWSVWTDGSLSVRNDEGSVAIFKQWDYIIVEADAVKA